MGYLKSPEEVAAAERALGSPGFVSDGRCSVSFRTDPDVLRSLLPAPLQPGDDAVAVATVGRWHGSVGSFSGGMLYLSASHEGVPGAYVLAMFMDSEPSVTFGRELLGEPKKLARAYLESAFDSGSGVHGWVERHGVRIIELSARVGEDSGPAQTERSTFNVKARTAADGSGLQEDALLTRTVYRVQVSSQRVGTGSVILRSTPHDPCGELPVLEVLGATYATERSTAACLVVASVPAATFLPYHLGRQDDWLAMAVRAGPAHPAGPADADDVVDAFLQAYNAADLDGMSAALAPDVVMQHPGRGVDVRGHESVMAHLARSASTTFPGRSYLPSRRRSRAGDRITIEHTWRATPLVDLPGFASAGQPVELEVCAMFWIEDGLITEMTEYG